LLAVFGSHFKHTKAKRILLPFLRNIA